MKNLLNLLSRARNRSFLQKSEIYSRLRTVFLLKNRRTMLISSNYIRIKDVFVLFKSVLIIKPYYEVNIHEYHLSKIDGKGTGYIY